MVDLVSPRRNFPEVAYRCAYGGSRHAACTQSVRLGKMGGVREGVKVDPERRAFAKVHKLPGEILSLPELAHDGLVHNLWAQVCRTGKEFLKCEPFTFLESDTRTQTGTDVSANTGKSET